MNVLARNKRVINYCKMYLDENGVSLYKKPVPIKMNFEPTNSTSQMFVYGDVYPLYLKATVLNKLARDNNMRAGDKCYIYAKPPKEHDTLCTGADYVVESDPLSTLNFTEIKFKRLTSDMSYE